jgi:hypothetical protein
MSRLSVTSVSAALDQALAHRIGFGHDPDVITYH